VALPPPPSAPNCLRTVGLRAHQSWHRPSRPAGSRTRATGNLFVRLGLRALRPAYVWSCGRGAVLARDHEEVAYGGGPSRSARRTRPSWRFLPEKLAVRGPARSRRVPRLRHAWTPRRYQWRVMPQPQDPKPARPVAATEHRNDLQGLRAVAVLMVAFGHAGVEFLKGGYVGVHVFFVLSDFLITGLLLSSAAKHGSVSLTDFYVRRARRILPAAALTLVVTVVVAYWLLNFVRAKQAVWDSLWASVFAANIHFAQQGTDYFAQGQPSSPVEHISSLAGEEQFYLVWPAVLSLVLFGAGLRRCVLWAIGRTRSTCGTGQC
jgi:Acyltransferase family